MFQFHFSVLVIPMWCRLSWPALLTWSTFGRTIKWCDWLIDWRLLIKRTRGLFFHCDSPDGDVERKTRSGRVLRPRGSLSAWAGWSLQDQLRPGTVGGRHERRGAGKRSPRGHNRPGKRSARLPNGAERRHGRGDSEIEVSVQQRAAISQHLVRVRGDEAVWDCQVAAERSFPAVGTFCQRGNSGTVPDEELHFIIDGIDTRQNVWPRVTDEPKLH